METNSLQGIPEWYNARRGHFTSSEIIKIMPGPRAKEGELQKTALTYIYEKLAEDMTNAADDMDPLESKDDIIWGREHEIEGRRLYEERHGVYVEDCGFFEWSEHFGGSPDGLVGDDGIIEIKCPFKTANHAKYLMLKIPGDLRELKPEYYAQIQGNLLATGRTWCDFISYDPRCVNPALRIKVLRIERDEAYIAQMTKAIGLASGVWVKLRNELANIILGR